MKRKRTAKIGARVNLCPVPNKHFSLMGPCVANGVRYYKGLRCYEIDNTVFEIMAGVLDISKIESIHIFVTWGLQRWNQDHPDHQIDLSKWILDFHLQDRREKRWSDDKRVADKIRNVRAGRGAKGAAARSSSDQVGDRGAPGAVQQEHGPEASDGPA